MGDQPRPGRILVLAPEVPAVEVSAENPTETAFPTTAFRSSGATSAFRVKVLIGGLGYVNFVIGAAGLRSPLPNVILPETREEREIKTGEKADGEREEGVQHSGGVRRLWRTILGYRDKCVCQARMERVKFDLPGSPWKRDHANLRVQALKRPGIERSPLSGDGRSRDSRISHHDCPGFYVLRALVFVPPFAHGNGLSTPFKANLLKVPRRGLAARSRLKSLR